MCRTCLYAEDMSKMIQVREVPEQVHSILKARAAREGMSLSDYIKRELEQYLGASDHARVAGSYTENEANPV